MNIFAEMLHSLYDIKGYSRFLEQGAFRTFLYGMVVDLIYIIASFLVPLALILASLGGPDNAVNTLIPDFTLEDNRLWVEEPVEYATFGSYFRIDTDHPITEEITASDLLAFDKAVVLDAEHAMVKSEGEIIVMSYEELDLGAWNRSRLMETLAPYIAGIVIAVLAASVIAMEIGFFLGALLTAVLGSVFASMLRCPMTLGDLYKLSVHARTMPLLLKLLLSFVSLLTPVLLGLPFIANFGLSAFYVWKAIRAMQAAENV